MRAHNFLKNDDGILYINPTSNETRNTLKKLVDQFEKECKMLRAENRSVLVLSNIELGGKQSTEVRQYGVELLRKLDYDRIALVISSLFLKYITNFVIYCSNSQAKVQIFTNSEDAKKWLLNNKFV